MLIVLNGFSGGDLAGEAAVTRNRFGLGVAYYLATRPDPPSMSALLAEVCRLAGVQATADVPTGVEAVRRQGGEGSFLFLLNHNDAEVEVMAGAESIRLGPRDVAVVRESP